jgi:diguanylate cyclase (GGDEF)-like protein
MTETSPQPAGQRTSMPAEERGLYSVAQIQHLLRIEFARAQRYAYPLSCMLLAVDQLDTLRDLHGYEFKEQVLERLVDLLKRATRSSDFLGRTADDRLVLLLPHTQPQGARSLGERLIENSGVLSSELGGNVARVSVSIGLASLQGEDVLFHDALYRGAELALEEAVAAGGGRLQVRAAGGQG